MPRALPPSKSCGQVCRRETWRGNAATATVYLTKGFTSDDRIRGTVGRGPGWPNIRRLVFTPQVFMGHDPPTRRARSRFRNSEHPRREWIERERERGVRISTTPFLTPTVDSSAAGCPGASRTPTRNPETRCLDPRKSSRTDLICITDRYAASVGSNCR